MRMKQIISHKFVRPYSRSKAKENLRNIVMDYFNNNHQEEHPQLFCAGIYICYYAAADCLYQKKRCYYG